jgi:hypothetical protein
MLTKSKIMAGLQCPKRLWLMVHRPEVGTKVDSPAIRQGNEVDRLAQELFPGGVLIEGRTLKQAQTLTAQAVAQGAPHIYQATVAADGVLVKADILSRVADGWVLTEVKSAASVKAEYLPDVAIQRWVMRQAGIDVVRAQVAHVDTSFVYQGDGRYDGLLKVVDVTAQAEALEPDVARWAQQYRQVLAEREPVCDIGAHCTSPYTCEFAEYCDPYKASRHRPDVLPRVTASKLADWRQRGILELDAVPDDEINQRQQMVKDSHLRDVRVVCDVLVDLLRQLPYPRFYMDFETGNPAVPRFKGMHPFQYIPFQWSCHIERAPGLLEHREFLVPDADDPRERFVVSLIEAMEKDGPVCVWSAAFEKGRLNELAVAFPEHAAALEAIADRMVDLYPIFGQHYYHPGMKGSWSIKAVLPTVDPAMAYDRLEGIKEGGAAMDAYSALIDPKVDAGRKAELRASLLTYCKHDTLAMVRLVGFDREAD